MELTLPEGRLVRLATDRGVFSAEKVDDGTRVLLAEGPPPGDATTLVDVGCGYGPIAITLARRRARGGGVGGRRERAGRGAVPGERRRQRGGRPGPRRLRPPRRCPPDLVVDQIWSNPPIRMGKAALHDLLRTWLGPAPARHRHRLAGGAEAPGCRLAGSGGSTSRAGPPHAGGAPRATGRYRVLAVDAARPCDAMSRSLGSTELKRSHRDWRRQAPRQARPAAGLRGHAVQRRLDRPNGSRPARRRHLDHRPDRTETHASTQKTALGSQRFVTFHHVDEPAAAAVAAHAAGYRVVGIELADGAVPLHQADLDRVGVPGGRPRGPGPQHGGARRSRRAGVHPPARPHRVAQRGHRRQHRPLRGPPPGLASACLVGAPVLGGGEPARPQP